MSSPSSQPVPHLFVSHSHADNAYCRELVQALRASGCAVWYDEHNLGWGALRQTIQRELERSDHFIAILSPAAISSTWDNREIDAAIDMLDRGELRTFLLVTAERCTVPRLLRGYKRMEHPDGSGYPAADAAARVFPIVAPATTGVPVSTPQPTSPPPSPTPAAPAIPPERFPERLASLGLVAARAGGVELITPPVCDVPDGEFLMGSDPRADEQVYDQEKPQHTVRVAAFQIARFPVTVAEYACFIRGGRKAPSDWSAQQGKLDYPVVNVSWHDAVAYAAWLSERSGESGERTGRVWRLPTEAEWEKAARWDAQARHSRIYPWGDAFEASRANTADSGIRGTTPVDRFPYGASPYDALDMAGNVWEWTSSLFKPYLYSATDGRENPNSTENRVLRGGSWFNASQIARAACRYLSLPGGVGDDLGFRLVLAAPGS